MPADPKTTVKRRRVNWLARAIAYEEAAEHLEGGIGGWTDDADERDEGMIIAGQLREMAQRAQSRVREAADGKS